MSVCIHGSYRLSDFRINDNALAKTSYAISQVRWPDFSRNYELLIDKLESKSKECFAALEDYGSRTKESCPPRACPGGCRGSRGARHGRQRIGERRLRAVRPGESFPFILCLLRTHQENDGLFIVGIVDIVDISLSPALVCLGIHHRPRVLSRLSAALQHAHQVGTVRDHLQRNVAGCSSGRHGLEWDAEQATERCKGVSERAEQDGRSSPGSDFA